MQFLTEYFDFFEFRFIKDDTVSFQGIEHR